jgi:hypothetical protein
MFLLSKIARSKKVIPLALTAGIGLGTTLYFGIVKNPNNLNNLTAIGAIASPITAVQAQQPTDTKVVRIGYQKYGTLNLLKAKGTLEREHLTYAISINTYGQKNKTLNFIELYQKKK